LWVANPKAGRRDRAHKKQRKRLIEAASPFLPPKKKQKNGLLAACCFLFCVLRGRGRAGAPLAALTKRKPRFLLCIGRVAGWPGSKKQKGNKKQEKRGASRG
jgi:hypothetical protein